MAKSRTAKSNTKRQCIKGGVYVNRGTSAQNCLGRVWRRYYTTNKYYGEIEKVVRNIIWRGDMWSTCNTRTGAAAAPRSVAETQLLTGFIHRLFQSLYRSLFKQGVVNNGVALYSVLDYGRRFAGGATSDFTLGIVGAQKI